MAASSTHTPLPAPLPELPSEDPLTPRQWETLFAICDVVIPSIKGVGVDGSQDSASAANGEYRQAFEQIQNSLPLSTSGSDVITREYLEETPSAIPAFREAVVRLFTYQLAYSEKRQLLIILHVLG
jgi:hypothetical protein